MGDNHAETAQTEPQIALVGESNEDVVTIDGVECPCLVDTGSMVTSISEQFLSENFSSIEVLPVNKLLTVTGASGMQLPYKGYVELPIKVPFTEDEVFVPILVMSTTAFSAKVPMVLGMNVIKSLLNRSRSDGDVLPKAWMAADQVLTK